MKAKIKTLFAAAAVAAVLPVQAAALDKVQDLGKELTGDVRLACEAVLCLSSGTRPGECAPSLRRYFSIHHKKLGDTIRARFNFLKMCPASGEDGMSDLIGALANGAGRCDAESLNRQLRYVVETYKCTGYHGDNCRIEKEVRIRDTPPSYCRAYFDHPWTDMNEHIRYQGTPDNGGRWVGQ